VKPQLSNSNGVYIAIEGVDGSGKTVQIHLLKKYLKRAGLRSKLFKEPTTGRIGRLLRHALSSAWTEHDEYILALLFAADRHALYHVRRPCVQESLRQGYICIVDRSVLTTFVYQGARLSERWLMEINKDIPKPDVTIAIKVSLRSTMKRLAARKIDKPEEGYEQPNAIRKFHRRYLVLFKRYKTQFNIRCVNGNNKPGTVHRQIVKILQRKLSECYAGQP
jgi:dTMP kinase